MCRRVLLAFSQKIDYYEYEVPSKRALHTWHNMHVLNDDNNANIDESSIRARDDDTRI